MQRMLGNRRGNVNGAGGSILRDKFGYTIAATTVVNFCDSGIHAKRYATVYFVKDVSEDDNFAIPHLLQTVAD
jgi:hypothetical protein